MPTVQTPHALGAAHQPRLRAVRLPPLALPMVQVGAPGCQTTLARAKLMA